MDAFHSSRAELAEAVYAKGIQRNTHRCPTINDERLQSMIPPELPELMNAYAKAVRKEQPTHVRALLQFSKDYFELMNAKVDERSATR